MIRNYLLISIRSLKKHFSYALINVFGLGLGLCTCLILVMWILHETSYDRFHEKAERIYRSSLEYSFGGQVARTSVSPTALLPTLLTLPEIETGVRVFNPSGWNPYIVRRGDKLFQENRFYAADSTFFDVFSYRLLKGNPETALARPYTVVLTEAMAGKYFPDEDPLGKTLNINGTQDYTVTGVMENAPTNSFLQFEFVSSFGSLRAAREDPIWWSANYQTFVVLHAGAGLHAASGKLNDIVRQAVAAEVTGKNDYVRYNFARLTDLYLRSDFQGEPEVVSDIQYIYIFSAVAFLILLIACINYVNLSTAKAADRAREVGIRKVVGAGRKQLFIQFIGESVVTTLLAFMVAYLLAHLLLPYFNDLAGKDLGNDLLLDPLFLAFSIIVLMVVAILAGAYPAFAITAFRPLSVLKGNFKTSGKGVWLRKSLVVFQFGISVILISGTLVIVKQLRFIQRKDLGYDRANTIILPLDRQTKDQFETLSTELISRGAAMHVARGTESPVNIRAGYTIRAGGPESQGVVTTGLLVDEEYLDAVGIEVLYGRNFTRADRERVTRDTVYSFILNRAALAALFIEPENAVGVPVSVGSRQGEIIGVVRDFHFSSLHNNISPLVIFPEEAQFGKIFVKISGSDVVWSIAAIRDVYSRIITHRPFEYDFMDEQYYSLYNNEQKLSSVFVVFATLAVVIACLGLLGLVAFSASQKSKEIGIRKVLGATASDVIWGITREFSWLVVAGIAAGLPVAYWMMSRWLQGFAYKTEIGAVPLITASVICILIALGSAGYHAVKASVVDPAEILRSE